MELIRSQIWEFRRSPSLRFLGAVLFLAHAITYFLWFYTSSDFLPLVVDRHILCWDFFPQCHLFQSFFESNWIFVVYLTFSLLGLIFILLDRMLHLAWFFLLYCFIVTLIAYSLNSTYFTNVHSLLLIANFFFLFLPSKNHFFTKLFVLFYITEGVIRFNPDWLSGYWFLENLEGWMDITHQSQKKLKALEWAAVFSIFIEMIAPLFLLTRHGQQIFMVSAILFIYHFTQWAIGPFFPPLIHILIVIYFIVYFFEFDQRNRETMYQSFTRPEPTRLWSWLLLFLFVLLQSVPLLPWKAPFTIPLTFQPLKIPPECKQYTFTNFKNAIYENELKFKKNSPFYCQKQFHYESAESLCYKLSAKPDFLGVSSYFIARDFSEKTYRTLFEAKNICPSTTKPSTTPNPSQEPKSDGEIDPELETKLKKKNGGNNE